MPCGMLNRVVVGNVGGVLNLAPILLQFDSVRVFCYDFLALLLFVRSIDHSYINRLSLPTSSQHEVHGSSLGPCGYCQRPS